LQVQIKVEDANTIRKLMMHGLEIWIDPAANQKKTLGILFPSARKALHGLKPDAGKNFELSVLVSSISLMGAEMMNKGERTQAVARQPPSTSTTTNSSTTSSPYPILQFPRLRQDKLLSLGIISEPPPSRVVQTRRAC